MNLDSAQDAHPSPPATAIPRRKPLRRVPEFCSTMWQLGLALWSSPLWWLVPFLAVLVVFAAVIVLVQTFPAVAPFLYAVF
jgi:hypothetical protein